MSEEIKEIVKRTYTEAVTKDSGCCGPSCCSPAQEVGFNEDYSNLEGYDQDADYGLGCGIPTEFAKIKTGDTVLDLGSGAGNDAFVARSIVGEKGKVVGVDFTEAMIEKSIENKQKLGFKNVEFILGDIESLPIEDASIDVAISNCVMNLVPDKNKAYKEVYRVLKPGGHFSISDIVLSGNLPQSIKEVAEMYAGCVSGALIKEDYIAAIKNASFKNIAIVKERKLDLSDELILQYATPKALAEFRKMDGAIYSITVYAEK